MTSHETALEAALWKLHEREHAKLGEMLANKDEANNWQGGKVNGITAALELVRNASTLSPDVSGLVERLLVDAEYCADRVNPSIRLISCDLTEAADAIASLSLQLAAVEKHSKQGDDLLRQVKDQLPAVRDMKRRAETAEASLSAAQAENERLRKALTEISGMPVVAMSEAWKTVERVRSIVRATLSTHSKGEKKDAE